MLPPPAMREAEVQEKAVALLHHCAQQAWADAAAALTRILALCQGDGDAPEAAAEASGSGAQAAGGKDADAASPSGLEGPQRAMLDLAVNISDPHGTTPLSLAARHGQLELIRRLAGSGARVSCQAQDSLNTPLHLACLHGQAQAVKALLDCGAVPDSRNAAGDTPLMFACQAGQLGCAMALLKAGSDPRAVNKHGLSALMVAAGSAHALAYAAVRALLQAVAARPVATGTGTEGASGAAQGAGVEGMRAWVNASESEGGNTALHYAARTGSPESVKLLLDSGADIRIRNKQGRTALGEADQSRSKECVVLLRAAAAYLEGDREILLALADEDPPTHTLSHTTHTHSTRDAGKAKAKAATTTPQLSPPAQPGTGADSADSDISTGSLVPATDTSTAATAPAATHTSAHQPSTGAASADSDISTDTTAHMDISAVATAHTSEGTQADVGQGDMGPQGAAVGPAPHDSAPQQDAVQGGGMAQTDDTGSVGSAKGVGVPADIDTAGWHQAGRNRQRSGGPAHQHHAATHTTHTGSTAKRQPGRQGHTHKPAAHAGGHSGRTDTNADTRARQTAQGQGSQVGAPGSWAQHVRSPTGRVHSTGQTDAVGSAQALRVRAPAGALSTGAPAASTGATQASPRGAAQSGDTTAAQTTKQEAPVARDTAALDAASQPPTPQTAMNNHAHGMDSVAGSDVPTSQQQAGEGCEEGGEDEKWMREARTWLQVTHPEAVVLDVGPEHILGCALDDLSFSQLDALECVYHTLLARLSSQRLHLARIQERERVEEATRLRLEILQRQTGRA